MSVSRRRSRVLGKAQTRLVAHGYCAAGIDDTILDGLVAHTGSAGALLVTFKAWTEQWWSNDYTGPAAYDLITVISWLYGDGDTIDAAYRLGKILDGTWDTTIDALADSIKAEPGIVVLRLMYEMNGNWNPYCETINGNSVGEFVLAWRYIVDRFWAKSVTNVRWCWAPNVIQAGNATDPTSLYPGDDYVDIVAMDGYNWGTYSDVWKSPEQLFGPTYDVIVAVAPSKPIWITEYGCAQDSFGGDKAAWVTSLPAALATRCPRISAVVCWNRQSGAEPDFRVNSAGDDLAAWQTAVHTGFRQKRTGLLVSIT